MAAAGGKNMNRKLTPEEALPRIRAVLELGQPCRLVVTGTSMVPFLRHEKDVVLLAPFRGQARPGDILFYLRGAHRPILHRVHRIEADGTLLICGDNQTRLEPVRPSQILAVVSRVERNGRSIDCTRLPWRLLSRMWMALLPVRGPLLRMLHWCAKRKHK